MVIFKDKSMADTKQEKMRCWKCDGSLSPETAIDLHSGVSVELFLCISCGRRWHAGAAKTGYCSMTPPAVYAHYRHSS